MDVDGSLLIAVDRLIDGRLESVVVMGFANDDFACIADALKSRDEFENFDKYGFTDLYISFRLVKEMIEKRNESVKWIVCISSYCIGIKKSHNFAVLFEGGNPDPRAACDDEIDLSSLYLKCGDWQEINSLFLLHIAFDLVN